MVIRRTLYPQIKAHISTPDVFTLIIGPRQAGKTYLMRLLKEDLEKQGEKTLSLNMDIDSDKPFFSSHQKMVSKIKLEIGEVRGYIFLDEIQRKENAGLFLKGLYDMKLPYKFIVSGSRSLELKEKIHESLPGRKRLFELLTLSFEEFVDFKTDYKYSEPENDIKELAVFFDVHKELLREYLDEYLNFGGYPRVVLAGTLELKRAEIDDIYKSYLERDIQNLLNLKKTDKLTNLVRIMASQAGMLVNVTELADTINISQQTVNDYLWYLEKTLIIQKVTPFFKNLRKEITKASVYYFVDLGLKNYSLNQFGNATLISPPQGFLFQNFIFNALWGQLRTRLSPVTMHFWRTQDKAKVDFVINTGLEVIPIEVKYSNLKKPEITRSFRSFLSKYKPKKAFIVHLGDNFPPVDYGGTKVYFIPYYNCTVALKDIA